MKNILQLLCISLVVGAVMAGMAGTEIYNPVFYGPVAIGQWNAVSNFAGVAATNGAYTNSVTYQYRLTATNSLGRLPYTVTNSVVIDGAMNHSAHLTWTYTPRVSCYVLERGTTGTWDQFVRIGASLTNAWDDGSSLLWMNGNYAATNECALSDFPTGSIPVVGITAGTFYDGAQGDAVSNAVSGLTNDVAVLQTNTATKAQGALADTALQVETDPVWTGWLSTNGTPLTAADVAPIGLLASNALTAADVAPIGLLASNALTQTDGAALGLVASNALTAADVAPIGLLASNALTQTDGAALGLVASNALTAADVAPIGLLASNALTQTDGAALGLLGTNALPKAGGTMTGPLTNLYGYFGNGSGLTNLMSDPSAWSGYAATQQVVWLEYPSTNILTVTGDPVPEPDVRGEYVWNGTGQYDGPHTEGIDRLYYDTDHWLLEFLTQQTWTGGVDEASPAGTYYPYNNATNNVTVAWSVNTNAIIWRAGYDATAGCWSVSRNGTNLWAAYPGSNVLSGPVVIGGVARETWPSEYSDTAIYGALNTVSNWTIAGSNLAATVAGNLSVVSNQAAAGSNLAAAVAGNLSVVSNWTVAASNLSANALPTTGGTMAGPLTNEHGYFGDGSGLTNLPGSTPFDGTELSNSVVGLGILITNAAEQATNYADSVGSAVGLVASNALPMDGGGTVTGDVAVTGGVTAGTLALTNGPVAGSVWVCTNANGSGELRQLAKMRLRPYGSALISEVNATNKWNATAVYSVGGLTGTVDGVKIHRAGSYLVGMNWAANYCTNPAQVGRASITLNNAVISVTEYSSPIANNAIQSTQTLITPASAGDIIGVRYFMNGESSGQTNIANNGGQLSVVELP